jgi:hypothetical protein
VEGDVILEAPDQKSQVFIVLIDLTRWLPEHVCKVFDEMSVRA